MKQKLNLLLRKYQFWKKGMRLVACNQTGLGCETKVRWSTGNPRGIQHVPVNKGFKGKAYCSIECMLYDKDKDF